MKFLIALLLTAHAFPTTDITGEVFAHLHRLDGDLGARGRNLFRKLCREAFRTEDASPVARIYNDLRGGGGLNSSNNYSVILTDGVQCDCNVDRTATMHLMSISGGCRATSAMR